MNFVPSVNLLRLLTDIVLLAAIMLGIAPLIADAEPNDYRCELGFSMQGSTASNSVYCVTTVGQPPSSLEADSRTPAVACPSGYVMQGTTDGRGAVRCHKPATETVRKNYPVCGIRRYNEDGQGETDTCSKSDGTYTGVPKCIGGTRSVRSGRDRCVTILSSKTRKPS